MDVLVQVVALCKVLQIGLTFFLGKEMRRPGIRLEQVFVEAEPVHFTGGVTGGSRILAPVPGAADFGGFLEALDRESQRLELVEVVDAAEAGTNNNGVNGRHCGQRTLKVRWWPVVAC